MVCLVLLFVLNLVFHAGEFSPFLGTHLYEPRACSSKCENLLVASEHRRRADDFLVQTLDANQVRTTDSEGEWVIRHTKSSMTLRI